MGIKNDAPVIGETAFLVAPQKAEFIFYLSLQAPQLPFFFP